MTVRPILFSRPMVQAIHAGRKTQTRRAMKPQPTEDFRVLAVEWYTPATYNRHGEMVEGKDIFGVYGDEEGYKCPYGAPGDRLWVRESFWADRTTGEFKWYVNDVFTPDRDRDHCRLKSGIFMPRAVVRTVLEITGVRVERLYDITEADAVAEGSEAYINSDGDEVESAVTMYERLWADINGEQSLADNPWVWVIEFRRANQESA